VARISFFSICRGKYLPANVANILKKAALKAGIRKNVTPHTFAYRFATHLLEQRANLKYIQGLSGT